MDNKIRKNTLLYIALCVLLMATMGCQDVTFDCNYKINVTTQAEQKGVEIPMTNGVGYLFYADTAVYEVGSYAEVVAGTIKRKGTSETINYTFKHDFASGNTMEFSGLNHNDLIFVVCDTANEIYAWKAAEIEPNLQFVKVNLHFRLWKTTYPYMESGWTFLNENPPVAPLPLDPPVEP